MGFGRGKGFTSKVRTEMTSYSVKGGGGKGTASETEANPTYSYKYGGGKGTATGTEVNPSYQVSVA